MRLLKRISMRLSLPIIVFLFSSFFLLAQQNLVPNGSFEIISNCPHYYSTQPTVLFSPPWQNPNPGTADLYSKCDTIVNSGFNAPGCGVPLNLAGFQQPKTGKNYGGFLVWGKPSGSINNVREYIQVQLLDSLIATKKYCVSFFVSLADSGAQYCTSRMGAYLSKNAITNSTQYLLNALPQIQNVYGNLLNDKINWVPIQGLFQGAGENYITIGNFFDDLNTDTAQVINNSSGRSYYFIDEISVVEYEAADAGNDLIICKGIKVKPLNTCTYGAEYNWSVLMGDHVSIDSPNVAVPSLTPVNSTTYLLQKKQCGITTFDTLIVRVHNSYPALVMRDTTVCVGDTIFVTAIGNCSWCNHTWNTGQSSLQFTVSPENNIVYTFSQTDSCFTTNDKVTIRVDPCFSPQVVVPNVFTPNGDELNDIWMPLIKFEQSLSKYNLVIYNRWGIKVFESSNTKQGWDGRTTSGVTCNEGTYYCIISYYDEKTKEVVNIKGFILLEE
jgi:gliding motility-associated-like protein